MSVSNRFIAIASVTMIAIACSNSSAQFTAPTSRSAAQHATRPNFHWRTIANALFYTPPRVAAPPSPRQRAGDPFAQPPSAHPPHQIARRPVYAGNPTTSRNQQIMPISLIAPVQQEVPFTAVSPTASQFGPCCHGGCNCGPASPAVGTSMNVYFDAHIHNGQKARQVLYHCDFENGPGDDPSQLNADGRRKVARLIPMIDSTGHPLIVQRVDKNPDLSLARRANVLGFVQTELGHPLSDAQVMVGDLDWPGLRGTEAIEFDRNQLQNTRTLGATTSGGRSNLPTSISTGQSTRGR